MFTMIWWNFVLLIAIVRSVREIGERIQVLNTGRGDPNAFKIGTITAISGSGPLQFLTIQMDNGNVIKLPEGMVQDLDAEEKRRIQSEADSHLTGPFEPGQKVEIIQAESQWCSRVGEVEGYITVRGDVNVLVKVSEDEVVPMDGGTALISRPMSVAFDLDAVKLVKEDQTDKQMHEPADPRTLKKGTFVVIAKDSIRSKPQLNLGVGMITNGPFVDSTNGEMVRFNVMMYDWSESKLITVALHQNKFWRWPSGQNMGFPIRASRYLDEISKYHGQMVRYKLEEEQWVNLMTIFGAEMFVHHREAMDVFKGIESVSSVWTDVIRQGMGSGN